MAKSVGLAVVLSIIIAGLGQIYLGRIKRGIVILIVGFVMSLVLSYIFGWIGILPTFAFWIWQIIDAYKIAKNQQTTPPSDTKQPDSTQN